LATGIYRFTFGASPTSDIAVSYSTDGTNFTAYNGNNKLQLSANDTLQIDLQGPTGWSMGGPLQVIVSRANGAASRQNYSPFFNGWVWTQYLPQQGTFVDPPNNTIWRSSPFNGAVQPGNGNKKYELTIGFGVNLPGVLSQLVYFSVDPEMDISTT
jgi:hypothetical protein